jgi:histidinol-phosphate aminotransferase
MSKFWSPVVQSLTPYTPGEQPKLAGLVKLNTNENPYGPSPKVIQAIKAEANDTLRLYPDPNADRLKVVLAEYHSLSPDQVFVGNGSDEVLAHAFMALLKHSLPILFPDITYSFFPVYSKLYEVTYETVPLNSAFEIDTIDYARPNGGIIIPNPNAPTGRLLPLSDINDLLTRNRDSVVVIDEAYIDFGGISAVGLIDTHPNLLVIQTLSKSRSLAGLRVGFAFGQPHLIEALERVKNSFNSYPLDRLAIEGALASIEDRDHFERTCRDIIRSRDFLTAELAALGFHVLPSTANFIFVNHPEKDASELSQRLRERSIVVRHFNQERIRQYLRISVGTGSECRLLVDALRNILAA